MRFSRFALLLMVIFGIYVNLPAKLAYDFTVTGNRFRGEVNRPLVDLSFVGINFKRDLALKEGLDIQGGSHLVFEAQVKDIAMSDRPAAVEAVRANIERRVNFLGVAEPIIQTARSGDSYRLVVELAGVKDVKQAIGLIGTTAQLDFREMIGTSSAEGFKTTGLTGADLKRADIQFDPKTGTPTVGLEFTPDGQKKFAQITKKNLGKPLAIYLDQFPVTAPVVESVIEDGRAVITGKFTVEEAKDLVAQLNSGALPVPVKLIEERTVGATLGTDSINKSLLAGIVGLAVVALFMVLNYGTLGLVADLALVFYIIFSLAVFRLVPVTMTLAGIAGFILSIGMAVDANILIFERIREEIRWGRTAQPALDLGFSRAWTSIRDSNVSSLMTCGILFWFGSGPVRGFALMLAIGIVVSLFTSINVTRSLLGFLYRHKD